VHRAYQIDIRNITKVKLKQSCNVEMSKTTA